MTSRGHLLVMSVGILHSNGWSSEIYYIGTIRMPIEGSIGKSIYISFNSKVQQCYQIFSLPHSWFVKRYNLVFRLFMYSVVEKFYLSDGLAFLIVSWVWRVQYQGSQPASHHEFNKDSLGWLPSCTPYSCTTYESRWEPMQSHNTLRTREHAKPSAPVDHKHPPTGTHAPAYVSNPFYCYKVLRTSECYRTSVTVISWEVPMHYLRFIASFSWTKVLVIDVN